jgi:hypothetical protein
VRGWASVVFGVKKMFEMVYPRTFYTDLSGLFCKQPVATCWGALIPGPPHATLASSQTSPTFP